MLAAPALIGYRGVLGALIQELAAAVPNLTCPKCRAYAHFEPLNAREGHPNAPAVGFGICASCKFIVLIHAYESDLKRVIDFFPTAVPKVATDPSVPGPIAEDFREALKCRAVGASKACAAMCRRAIQGTAVKLGAPKKRLIDQIDWLEAERKITPLLNEAAHRVRAFGNTGAHPGEDGLDSVTKEDADDAVAFTEELIDHVFAVAARLGMSSDTAASVE